MKRVCFFILLVLSVCTFAQSQPYTWKSVQMVGGGFVDGIVFHPTAKDVRYARTDMGGAYRWEAGSKSWVPLLDSTSYEKVNRMGVESIALDPNNPNRVYMACGTYTNPRVPDAEMLRSDNRGKTWEITPVPFKMGGNENGRGNGERMQVDPNNSDILYFGSRQVGLWRSTDRSKTWRRVDSFPFENVTTQSVGVNVVVFDPRSGDLRKKQSSTTIYAAVSQMGQNNLFVTKDSGATWNPVPGSITALRPTHMLLAKDGMLYVTYGTDAGPNRMRDGAVVKLDTATGAWTDVTPEKPDPANQKAFGYAAVSVDSKDPHVLIVSSFGHPGGEQIFRTLDSGKTWKAIIGGPETYDFSIAPYVARTGIHWLFDVEIDPANSNHALFTTGYGGYETFNLTDNDLGKPVKWSVMSKGIEETVALELASPPSGAHLFTAIGDYGGFVHWDLDKPALDGNYDKPHFGNTNSVTFAENNPSVVVRVGRASGNRGGGNIGYSLDGGKSWQTTATTPTGATLGRIAVSSDGKTWIWCLRNGSFRTTDMGATWIECTGLKNVSRVIADKVNPNKFYAMDLFGGKLFTSLDGGVTFAESPIILTKGLPVAGGNRGDGRGGQDWLYATPGHESDVWIAAFEGLHHSLDGGKSFVTLDKVQEIHAFGFGKAAPKSDYPALYLVGVVSGVRGVYRSDDAGKNWVRINDDDHQWGLILQITGDPRVYGRVYVGTHGRGTVYGDIKKSGY